MHWTHVGVLHRAHRRARVGMHWTHVGVLHREPRLSSTVGNSRTGGNQSQSWSPFLGRTVFGPRYLVIRFCSQHLGGTHASPRCRPPRTSSPAACCTISAPVSAGASSSAAPRTLSAP